MSKTSQEIAPPTIVIHSDKRARDKRHKERGGADGDQENTATPRPPKRVPTANAEAAVLAIPVLAFPHIPAASNARGPDAGTRKCGVRGVANLPSVTAR